MRTRRSLNSINDIQKKTVLSPLRSPKKKKVEPFHPKYIRVSPKPSMISTTTATHHRISKEEFTSMLEIPEPSSSEPSLLGQSLFDLSIELRSLDDVLNQIINFRLNAPLSLYSYASLIELIHVSVQCPPDAVLLLLSVGGRMITKMNYAQPKYLRELIKFTKYLIRSKFFYVSYGKNQPKPQRKLVRLLKLFEQHLTIPPHGKEGTFDTRKIEELMNRNRKRNEQKLKKELKRRMNALNKSNQKSSVRSEIYDDIDKTEIMDDFDDIEWSLGQKSKTLISSDKLLSSSNDQFFKFGKDDSFDDNNEFSKQKTINTSSEINKEYSDKNEKSRNDDSIDDTNHISFSYSSIKRNKYDNDSVNDKYSKDNNHNNNNSSSDIYRISDYMKNFSDILSSKEGDKNVHNNEYSDDNVDNNKENHQNIKNLNSSDHNSEYSDDNVDNNKENHQNIKNLNSSDHNSEYSDDKVFSNKKNHQNTENLNSSDHNSDENNENGDIENQNLEENYIFDEKHDFDHHNRNNSYSYRIKNDGKHENPKTDKNSNSLDDNIIALAKINNKLRNIDNIKKVPKPPVNPKEYNLNQSHQKNDTNYKNLSLSQGHSSFTSSADDIIRGLISSTDDLIKGLIGSNALFNDDLNRHMLSNSDARSTHSVISNLSESVQMHLDISPSDNFMRPSSYAPEDYVFDDEETENIKLADISGKFLPSIERFFLSNDTIYERREKGSKRLQTLTPEQRKQISDLAKLFVNWKTAYASSQVVWNVMKTDENFDIDVLLSQIPVSYGDFLIEALKTFAQQEGIHIKDIVNQL